MTELHDPTLQTARHRIWQAIRIYRRFESGELVAVLSLPCRTVRNYVGALKRHGVLRSVRGGAMLVRDLGPKAPFEAKGRRRGQLIDPNRAVREAVSP